MSMAAAIRAPAIADPIPTPAAAPGLIEFELFCGVVLLGNSIDGFGVASLLELLVLSEVRVDVVIVSVELVDGAVELRLGDGSVPDADGAVDKDVAPNPTPDGNVTTT